jgi:hypothetical protein
LLYNQHEIKFHENPFSDYPAIIRMYAWADMAKLMESTLLLLLQLSTAKAPEGINTDGHGISTILPLDRRTRGPEQGTYKQYSGGQFQTLLL